MPAEVRSSGPLVLGTNPVKFPTRIADRDRTVSRRSEPSSRTTLIGNSQTLGTFSNPRMWWADIEVQTPPDMDSWGYQPVIPGTFYPLSDGPSTRNHRITMTVFDSARHVRLAVRQAYAIALKADFNQPEPTIARLRYSLRRRPPQSNYPPYRVPHPDNGCWLDIKNKGWCFILTPQKLAPLLRLPPSLHIIFLIPLQL